MFRRRRGSALVATFTALLLGVAACGGGGGDGDGTASGQEKTAITVQSGDIRFLGPPGKCYASECAAILNVLYTGLTDINMDTGEIIYRNAKSIKSKDQQTWIVTLEKGWKFHNGEPVTAMSYIRAWNWNAYGPHGADTNGFFTPIKGYDALNPSGENAEPKTKKMSGLTKLGKYKFKVELKYPFTPFPKMVAYTPAFAPVAKECLQDIKACNDKPIGNGPYKMKGEWERKRQVVVTQYDDYKGKNTGHVDKITFKPYTEVTTAFNDFLAGDLDITSVPPEKFGQAKSQAGDRLITELGSAIAFLGMPTYKEPYDDPKVRKAISLAINRKAIAENIFSGLAKPATDIGSPVLPGYRKDACDYCHYDPQKAKQLLKESGAEFPNNTITLWFNSGSGHDQWMTAVGNQLKKAFGVDYKLQTLQWSEYLGKLDNGKVTGPFRSGWLFDYPSKISYLKPLFSKGAPTNYWQWSSEKFAKLLKKGSSADTQEQAIKYYQQAADVVLQDAPAIPLWHEIEPYVYSEDITNVKFDALDRIDLTKVKPAE